MKPKKKNLVICPDCGRRKMLFETESKANNFIKFNGDDIDTHGGELRPYYCPACNGYHISSKPHKWSYDHQTEKLIETYKKDLEVGKIVTIKDGKLNDSPSEFERIINDVSEKLPDINTKKELKEFLTDYFVKNDITKQQKQDNIRHFFNEMIESGELSIEGHKIKKPAKKNVSDDEIFDMIPEESKTSHNKFMESLRLSVQRYDVRIDKEQMKRLEKMWFDYNYEQHNK